MNIEETKRFIKLAYAKRDEIVPCLLGAPGIGKTQCVEQLAEELGVNLVTIIASQVLPSEVSGIPMPVTETHSLDVFDHVKLSSLKDGDILFLDELLEGDPMVLSAMLTLIESRQMMSGRKLPDVMIVAATNETKTPKQVQASLRQRFFWIRVEYDSTVFRKYLAERYGRSEEACAELSLAVEQATSSRWNYMSPRTLVKVLDWLEPMDDSDRRWALNELANSGFNGTSKIRGFLSAVRITPEMTELLPADVRIEIEDAAEDAGISFEAAARRVFRKMIEEDPERWMLLLEEAKSRDKEEGC